MSAIVSVSMLIAFYVMLYVGVDWIYSLASDYTHLNFILVIAVMLLFTSLIRLAMKEKADVYWTSFWLLAASYCLIMSFNSIPAVKDYLLDKSYETALASYEKSRISFNHLNSPSPALLDKLAVNISQDGIERLKQSQRLIVQIEKEKLELAKVELDYFTQQFDLDPNKKRQFITQALVYAALSLLSFFMIFRQKRILS